MPELREAVVAREHLLPKVRRKAVEQRGVISRSQLLDADVTPEAIRQARLSHRLYDLHPGVYSIAAPELLADDAALVAALLAVGRHAYLSDGSAAWRHRIIPAPPERIHIASSRCLRPPSGVEAHRRLLRDDDVCTAGGLPMTTVPRTLLDLAISYHLKALLRALAEAEFEHDLRPDDVLATLRRGHPGSARLRAALDEHVPGFGEAKQRLERAFRTLLIGHRIALPLRNEPVGAFLLDCLWPEHRLVVELDGGHHQRPHRRAADAERDHVLRQQGFTVIRYTWRQVHEQGHAVAAEVAGILAGRS
jgi:very-short-patch-repair endonuclease